MPMMATALLVSSLTVASSLGAATGRARRTPDRTPVPCDPSRCVTAKFEFTLAWPQESTSAPSKFKCPAGTNGDTLAEPFSATFSGGFGDWDVGQCVHKAYTPGFLAFAGPGAYSGDYVPACPAAIFCACGAVRDKIVQLLNDPTALKEIEGNPSYWASLAPSFTAVQGFTPSGSGSTWDYLDLVYQHGDGRRQFCSGVNSWTYDVQNGKQHPNSAPAAAATLEHKPSGYTTQCGPWWGGCEQGFAETGSSGCGWWFFASTKTCKPEGNGDAALTESDSIPGATHATHAADQEPVWGAFGEFGACSKRCNGGVAYSRRSCAHGTGSHVDVGCKGETFQQQTCSSQACSRWTSPDYEWSPSCPPGFQHVSTAWSWARRKWTCIESE